MSFSFKRLLVTIVLLNTLEVCWSRSCGSSEIFDTESINKNASKSLVYIKEARQQIQLKCNGLDHVSLLGDTS